uniref:Uncharacterized protein n=1 Tax=Arundo donax TaxID=35708 RepID=A0A0A8ZNC1_ARUDO
MLHYCLTYICTCIT